MRERDEGFILVAMIWILAILAVITMGFAHRALIDRRAAALTLDHSKAQYLARGAVNYAVADIRNKAFVRALIDKARDRLAGTPPGTRRRGGGQRATGMDFAAIVEPEDLLKTEGIFTAAGSAEGNKVSYSVTDEEGRISVNTAPEEVLDQIDGLGMRTVAAIMRHRGSQLAPQDREDFLAVDEVRLLDDIGMDEWEGDDGHPGLRELFTIYGDGRINVNSASREVLAAIPDLDDDVIDRIVRYRNGEDGKPGTRDDRRFQSLEAMSLQIGADPTGLAPLSRYCTFESHFFTITGFAALRQGKVRAAAQAVVDMEAGNAAVLTWSEGEFGPQVTY